MSSFAGTGWPDSPGAVPSLGLSAGADSFTGGASSLLSSLGAVASGVVASGGCSRLSVTGSCSESLSSFFSVAAASSVASLISLSSFAGAGSPEGTESFPLFPKVSLEDSSTAAVASPWSTSFARPSIGVIAGSCVCCGETSAGIASASCDASTGAALCSEVDASPGLATVLGVSVVLASALTCSTLVDSSPFDASSAPVSLFSAASPLPAS